MNRHNKTSRSRRVAFGVMTAGLFVLAACAARVDARGNLPDPDLLASMETGTATRDEVEQLLGSPSTIAMFENETWFYISEQTKTVAFFEPEVTERSVIIVEFDKVGTLLDIQTRGLDMSQVVEPSDRETPTLGNDLTMLQQLIGNFGRFNKSE